MSKKSGNIVYGIFGLFFLLVIGAIIEYWYIIFIVAVVVLSFNYSGNFSLNFYGSKKFRKEFESAAESCLNSHINALARKRLQTVYTDEYGVEQTEKWYTEIKYFIDNVLSRSLNAEQMRFLNENRSKFVLIVENEINKIIYENSVNIEYYPEMTPLDYEEFCASQLRNSGWDARATKASGDQGIDVIAEKNGTRIVLQCKLYSGSVGNYAVQEIVAGRQHEGAKHGFVVTNSNFTKSARQLASTNNIVLIHHSQLSEIGTFIGMM